MPSPDFSTYIDFSGFDEQPAAVYQDAVAYAQTALPEFNPRPGTIEDAILQAGAYVGALSIGAINRLPNGLVEGILKIMGVTRIESTAGTVDVEIEFFDAGQTVDAGTLFVYDYFDGSQVIQLPFVLNDAATANEAETTLVATLTSLINGVIPSISIGTQFLPASPSSLIFSCTTTSVVSQGDSSETETQFLNRAATYLQSLSSTLNTATQIENYVLLNYSNVKRCKVYDLVRPTAFTATSGNGYHLGTSASAYVNPAFASSASAHPGTTYRFITPEFYGDTTYSDIFPSGIYTTVSDSLSLNAAQSLLTYTDNVSSTASVGEYVDVVMMDTLLSSYTENNEEPGYFAIFVLGENGLPVGRETKNIIKSDIQSRVSAGLLFDVIDASVYYLNVTATIAVRAGFNSTTVSTDVKTEIESFISPNQWPQFDSSLRIFDLVGRILSVEGVQYVSAISTSVPEYPDVPYGNSLLVQEITTGATVTSYESLYAGTLPQAIVEIIVL
jgi:hypothetical protein